MSKAVGIVSQKDYLKKYLNREPKKKKKKDKDKKRVGQRPTIGNTKILDDDIDINALGDDGDHHFETAEDLPTVAEFIDETGAAGPKSVPLPGGTSWKTVSEFQDTIASLSQMKSSKGSWTALSISKTAASVTSNATPWNKMKKSDSEREKCVQDRNSALSLSKQRKMHDFDAPSTSRQNRDSDASPPRQRKRHDSDASPPRQRKRHDSDASPPRQTERHDPDASPPRQRKRHDSDASPSRQRKRHDSDASPPRQRKRHDSDASPSRQRKRHDSDASPPRQRKRHDYDASPPRQRKRHDSDASPTRQRKRHDSDASPTRQRKRHDSDASPPRQRKRHDSDASPPRQRKRHDSDASPTRQRKRHDSDASSTLRQSKRYDSHKLPSRHESRNESEKGEKSSTLSGKRSGLQDAASLRQELEERKKKEKEAFSKLDDSMTGKGAAAVIRQKKKTEEELFEEEQKARRKKEREEKYSRWGKGVKQLEEERTRLQQQLNVMNQPLNRYAPDEDFDKEMKDAEREGDPMLKYIQKKKEKDVRGDGEIVAKPKYKGPPPPPNRFKIPPGYRWDGVDRSNGYEKQYFDRINQRKATENEAYKWSVEDM
ncbi:unnamed protein product [Cyprideis torosa]|uniref:BUD13 homolog n=1 Tax=Cyprideis torosa TaxID=163714 RepID=A0A7R8W9R5_9CRUS|nr:unnamed protein product [Cyprideis torosa]CAG0885124.1 unnamed protein product [Cyprideis torosa]